MENIDKINANKLKADKALKQIVEMIEDAIILSEKLGKHPLSSGCSCMACVTQKKRMLERRVYKSKFLL
ncbi:MAG: hypothetical protein HF978_15545 [Desulfobacteraceae bacterium]|nr:hypothetical protein [Desulfobacteraceae bacterium]MBC2756956.1 hypothetical protein [Desulfobacteraceae bacterium]